MANRLFLKYHGVSYFTVNMIKKHFWTRPAPDQQKLREVMASVNVDCLNHSPRIDPAILKFLCQDNACLYEFMLTACDHQSLLIFLDTLKERNCMVLCKPCYEAEKFLIADLNCINYWQQNKTLFFVDSIGNSNLPDTIIHDPCYRTNQKGIIYQGKITKCI